MEDYKKTNREKRLTPRTSKFWCINCDHYLLGEGEKCGYCGKRSANKRLKKETNS